MDLIARILIVTMFLYASWSNTQKTDRLKGLMQSKNIPFVDIVFPLTKLFMFISSLAIIFNFYTFFAALYLIIFMILATFYFAGFWKVEGTDRDLKLNQFTLNVTVIGGLLLLAVRV